MSKDNVVYLKQGVYKNPCTCFACSGEEPCAITDLCVDSDFTGYMRLKAPEWPEGDYVEATYLRGYIFPVVLLVRQGEAETATLANFSNEVVWQKLRVVYTDVYQRWLEDAIQGCGVYTRWDEEDKKFYGFFSGKEDKSEGKDIHECLENLFLIWCGKVAAEYAAVPPEGATLPCNQG